MIAPKHRSQAFIAAVVIICERTGQIRACPGGLSCAQLDETEQAPRDGGMAREARGLRLGDKGFGAGARRAVIAAHHVGGDTAV